MRDVAVVGVGMTKFGKFLERGLKDLAGEAIGAALADAGVERGALQAAFVGNAVAGLLTGQECVRGQVVLSAAGIEGIPVHNLENACASASSAFQQAWLAVAGGLCDVALAVGMEKLSHEDKNKAFQAFEAAMDVDISAAYARQVGGRGQRSIFMDVYAEKTQAHMDKYGTTREQVALVAVKNHHNGCLNPYAQYQVEVTVEEVLQSRPISGPLTLLMCSPMGDGAAAAVLCSADFARRLERKPVWVAASALRSSVRDPNAPNSAVRSARAAYEMAGLGPEDLDVVEVHDATAPAELFAYEDLGLCAPGECGRLIEEGVTALGGRMPVNTSGGLSAKGHPVGATGLAQIAEIVWQLRGEAGERQVPNAKVGLTHNVGGWVHHDGAAACLHILKV